MKTLYVECNMGAAGDMLMSALLELVDNPDEFIETMNRLGLEGVHVVRKTSVKCGIVGTHIDVHVHGVSEESVDMDMQNHGKKHEHEHLHTNGANHHQHGEHTHQHNHVHENMAANQGHSHEHVHRHNHDNHSYSDDDHGHSHDHEGHTHSHLHSGMSDITAIINNLAISDKTKNNTIAIYKLIAEAESKAHGKPICEIHFHEVGTMDAIADIVGVCILMEKIGAERIIVSPVHLGSGFVKCAHGVLPVPAPATAHILQGVPTYTGKIKGELCTPTGAAILKHFADEFGQMPEMITESIGYGMGNKDFEAANCVRAFVGETKSNEFKTNGAIAELSCNLDDSTGEAIGFCTDILFQNGALDVFTQPIQMKKNRPGVLLTCICSTEKADYMASLILKHTTTFGVRKTICQRYMLEREFSTINTKLGPMRIKTGTGFGVSKSKAEYEDIAVAAKKAGISIYEVYDTIDEYL